MKLPIPVTVLTGFLGSGKTTVLKRLLDSPDMAGTAVIVNEFGEVGLDDALIEASEEETILLPSGCVCCAVRGDLVNALKSLADKAMAKSIPELSRIVIETTGLADPAPIAHTLMTEEELFRFFSLDGIVTTVDGELGLDQLDAQFEPAKQIAIGDVILLTKVDRANDDGLSELRRRVAILNPAARVLDVVQGDVTAKALFNLSAFEPIAVRAHADGWLNAAAYNDMHQAGEPNQHTQASDPHTHHDPTCHDPACNDPSHTHATAGDNAHAHNHLHGIQSFAIICEQPLDGRKLSFVLELLRSAHGDKLLRIKGLVNVDGEAAPFVIHGVQHVFYPPSTLEAWPSDDHRSRLVFITRDLDEATVRQVLAPLFQSETSERPLDPNVWATK